MPSAPRSRRARPPSRWARPVLAGECHPEPLVGLPLAMMNRHGLIAGATGTGKTKTLQLMAEQLSTPGVPVFLADVKGDLSGMARAGRGERQGRAARAGATGCAWKPAGFPVEFLSLTGAQGAQLRATVSSFGPLLLAKVLDLNETQTSVLAMVFKYCDDQRPAAARPRRPARGAPVPDRRRRAEQLKDYGGMSKADGRRAAARDGRARAAGRASASSASRSSTCDDLLRGDATGAALVSVLELTDVQDRPALFSTFMMWMLARLYHDLPEVGDLDKPKLVFFFDEAHLLFDGASKAFLDQVAAGRAARSARRASGVFFVTQSPKDVPADVLGQLGNRCSTRCAPSRPTTRRRSRPRRAPSRRPTFYDVEETLTIAGHRRGAGHRADARRRADAAVRDAHDPARLAHGAAHRAGDAPGAAPPRRRCASTRRRWTARARARCWRRA